MATLTVPTMRPYVTSRSSWASLISSAERWGTYALQPLGPGARTLPLTQVMATGLFPSQRCCTTSCISAWACGA